MKYLLYRSFGNLDKDVKKHELVAVEYGKDIYDVTDALIPLLMLILSVIILKTIQIKKEKKQHIEKRR